jgi:hypothetical protein
VAGPRLDRALASRAADTCVASTPMNRLFSSACGRPMPSGVWEHGTGVSKAFIALRVRAGRGRHPRDPPRNSREPWIGNLRGKPSKSHPRVSPQGPYSGVSRIDAPSSSEDASSRRVFRLDSISSMSSTPRTRSVGFRRLEYKSKIIA